MKVPKGLTEAEVLSIIESAVAYLAPSFKFGYFDIDDMRQEGTIFCLEALDSFDFKKSNQDKVGDALLTFLKTHVRWRFLNMRRKQLTRVEPPQCECALRVADSEDRLDCPKYSNWIKRNMSKKSLMEPFDVDDIHSTAASTSEDVDDIVISSDILTILDEHIPASIRADYKRFIEGVSISKSKRERLISHIKNILSEKWGDV